MLLHLHRGSPTPVCNHQGAQQTTKGQQDSDPHGDENGGQVYEGKVIAANEWTYEAHALAHLGEFGRRTRCQAERYAVPLYSYVSLVTNDVIKI